MLLSRYSGDTNVILGRVSWEMDMLLTLQTCRGSFLKHYFEAGFLQHCFLKREVMVWTSCLKKNAAANLSLDWSVKAMALTPY